MQVKSSRLVPSLRVKLVLSYLCVALGAILLLVLVVQLAVQNYFYQAQQDQLKANAENAAQQIGQIYHNGGRSWDSLGGPLRLVGPAINVVGLVVDTHLQVRSIPPPVIINNIPALSQALQQALQGQEAPGSLQVPVGDGSTIPAVYISVPLYDGGQANGKPIGALLLVEFLQYPAGFSPNAFLANVNHVILFTGLAIAIIVIIFSLLLARSLTRPLTSLTLAAEEMKGGNYTQRVDEPKSQDELGRLASTFNAMADKIESDVNELRHQDQVRRELIANIAHDLVTPLTAIQGFSEALADDVISEPKERQETAQLIGREVQRLRRLVSDMQHMSSLESGWVQLDLAPLDLHALADEVLEVIGPECEQAGITLHNAIAPGTPLVLADSDRVTQVLLNLLDNARRYTPPGGSITIGARANSGAGAKWLDVWVSDTGIGINADDLPYIFDRFFRSDRSRTGASGGSGLGLAIVKAVVTAHGGTIHAESAPGEGTRITFTLPLVQGQSSVHYKAASRNAQV
jgi:two-component system, OmpR family, sensor histidine kinase BaeS